jgi:hypothetical protein
MFFFLSCFFPLGVLTTPRGHWSDIRMTLGTCVIVGEGMQVDLVLNMCPLVLRMPFINED